MDPLENNPPEALRRCHLPWAQAFVNANGVISPCCAPLSLGNTTQSDLADIFNGDAYRTLREDLSEGRASPATRHCRDCYTFRKHVATGYTFEAAYDLGPDTESALADLETDYPRFVANYRAVREAYRHGTPLPPGARPLRLEIQLGEHCDIRCIMCWQDHDRPRALRAETMKEMAGLLPYALDVLVTGGEPTIFKEFWRLVETFKESAVPRAKLQLLTHGQHLEKHLHRFEGIPQVGFCVNVDGPDRESYERIRSGANWDKLNGSLAAVAEARKTHPGWGLNTTFLLMKSNIERIDDTLAFAERYHASWSCGMLAGEYTPIAQCRTYFEENIFRFDHLGYRTGDIVQRLEASLPRAAAMRDPKVAKAAVAGLQATIQQVQATPQLHVSPAKAASLFALTDPRVLSNAIAKIVNAAADRGKPDLASLRSNLAGVKGKRDANNEGYPRALLELGIREAEKHRHKTAAQHLRKALLAWRRLGDPGNEDIAQTEFHLGRCLEAQRKPEGIVHLEAAWQRMEMVFGAMDFRTAQAALSLGTALNRLGKHQEAIPVLQEAHAAYTAINGAQELDSYLAVSARELGTAFLMVDDAAAVPLLEHALRMIEAMWGPDHHITNKVAHKLIESRARYGMETEAGHLMDRFPGLRSYRNWRRIKGLVLSILPRRYGYHPV